MAINRTGKGNVLAPPTTITSSTSIPPTRPNIIDIEPIEKPKLTKAEIEKGKQDIAAVNNDLRLLSTLLGRPISFDDLPNIEKQFGGNGARKTKSNPTTIGTSTTTTTTTTSTSTTVKPPTISTTITTTEPTAAIVREVELLQTLLKNQQQNDVKSSPEYYGKTDEAILATILRQQGIGPSHNNIPIEVRKCFFLLFNKNRGLVWNFILFGG